MLTNYLKVALKVLLRRKFYTAINLLGVAFTLLVLVLVAALADNYLAPGAPEVSLNRILAIDEVKMTGPQYIIMSNPGYRLLDEYARDLPGVETLSITTTGRSVASFVDGKKIVSTLTLTDGAFWRIMKFDFVEGGPYTQADDEGGNFVAVINQTTRKRFFGAGPALGRVIQADGQAFTVVGVVRDVPVTRILAYSEIWAPINTFKSTTYRSALRGEFRGILLAKSAGDIPAIQQEYRRRLASAQLPDPEHFDKIESGAFTRLERLSKEFGPGDEPTKPHTGRLLLIVALAAGGFMLLPALNMVNLSLSRIMERASEIGVRKAFGASSLTLVGQFLVENVVLTLAGGAIGFVLSFPILGIVNDSGLIAYAQLTVSYRVFLAGLLLALAFAVVAGALPAWRMSRLHPVEALHGRVR